MAKVKARSAKWVEKILLEKGSRHQKHLEERKKTYKKYHQTDKYKAQYFKNKLKRYNLTVEKYNDIFAGQNGQCAICFVTLKDIPSKQVHIDHYSKGVRGILCMQCNQAIGLLKHNIDTIKRAANYLQVFGHN